MMTEETLKPNHSYMHSLFGGKNQNAQTPPHLYHFPCHSNSTGLESTCAPIIQILTDWQETRTGPITRTSIRLKNHILPWVERAYEEHLKGKLIVLLLPVRTSTRWFHQYVMRATEVRLVLGHLKFSGYVKGAPFAVMVVVFDGISRGRASVVSADLNGRVIDTP